MKKRKLLCLAICFTLCTGIFAGCSSKKDSDSNRSGQSSRNDMESKEDTNYPVDVDRSYLSESGSSANSQATSDTALVEESEWNTEEYNAIEENGYHNVLTSPLSTFSADVDTASYANVRRLILNGSPIYSGSVRAEEMINYFKYDYERPVNGEPFGVTTEIIDCPWNKEAKLLSIGLQAEDMDYSSLPNSNLVFLLDVSGSMDTPDKLPLMVQAFQLLSENLTENDTISIVTYAGYDEVLLEGVHGDRKQQIVKALENLSADGSTNGSSGINTAYALAEKYFIKGCNNRVILATDGDLNVGITSEGDLKKLIEEKRETGIYLSVLGFGTENIKDNKMETLADNGNGNYSYIDSVLEARKVLVEEMGGTLFTVAKDVKFQVEFNPAKVKEYRLVGYENRLMNAEDFNDDTKDAGEVGAGHRVTALYELILNDGEVADSSAHLKYQNTNLTNSNDWLTVSIRYKAPDSDESQLLSYPVGDLQYTTAPSENIIFASCVAQFAMLLNESDYAENITYRSIKSSLSGLKCMRTDEYKQEFYDLVAYMESYLR